MEGQITDAVMKTKAVIADPSNEKKKADAKKALTNLQVPLANAIDALSPSKLNDLKKKCREVDAGTQSVAAAAKDGDKQAANSLLEDLQKKNADLEKLANARAAELASTDPIQSENIHKALKEVEGAQDRLKHAVHDVLANPHDEDAQKNLDNAVDGTHNALRDLEAAAEGKSVGQDVADGSNKLDDMLNVRIPIPISYNFLYYSFGQRQFRECTVFLDTLSLLHFCALQTFDGLSITSVVL